MGFREPALLLKDTTVKDLYTELSESFIVRKSPYLIEWCIRFQAPSCIPLPRQHLG
jgi:hypothetical protein